MPPKQTRRKRLKRAKDNLPTLKLTARDLLIVLCVYLYRALTTKQITALVFDKDTRSTQCEARTQKLFHHGYLYRRSQGTQYLNNKPLVYMLTEKGAQLLVQEKNYQREELYWKPKYNAISNYHLQHVLAVSEIRIALARAVSNLDLELSFLDEMTIRHKKLYDEFFYRTPTGWEKRAYLIPDAFFTIDVDNLCLPFFLEVDRGTETLTRVADKYAKYLYYLETDEYVDRYGVFDVQGNEVPATILTITNSEVRMNNLIEVALDIGGDERFLFSTFDDSTYTKILNAAVWLRVGENRPIVLMDG